MKTKQYNFRLTEDQFAHLKFIAKATGQRTSDVVIGLIELSYAGITARDKTIIAEQEAAQKKLTKRIFK